MVNNADRSFDIYLAPKAPGKANNWLKTLQQDLAPE
jgi:hypothetical protein